MVFIITVGFVNYFITLLGGIDYNLTMSLKITTEVFCNLAIVTLSILYSSKI